MWLSKHISLKARPRGFHLITQEITDALPEITRLRVGLLHVFIQHTSAALCINENADPSVRRDFLTVFNRLIPESSSAYEHNDEGLDDLPAHIKASLLGSSISLPVANGRLQLGTWQGVYLCEHRDHGGARRLVLTLQGED
ncbi:MAG TPA: secondary thiamine-phosphate synthase enzyme YjbQ [Marinagarivorans sp.]|nr:secondary thiamine-phosphate synthase enzyme YjbQ [Marinagarivorans sp.]HNG59596.1 secondary thiamine-phosphate synthase enzyme YjbQ [Cellvibrionaceae bacterium]